MGGCTGALSFKERLGTRVDYPPYCSNYKLHVVRTGSYARRLT